MKVNRILYRPMRDDGVAENISRRYAEREGLTLIEDLSFQSTSDFIDNSKRRISYDNGKTWTPDIDAGRADNYMYIRAYHEIVGMKVL